MKNSLKRLIHVSFSKKKRFIVHNDPLTLTCVSFSLRKVLAHAMIHFFMGVCAHGTASRKT